MPHVTYNVPVALGVTHTQIAAAWNKPAIPGKCQDGQTSMYPVSVFTLNDYNGIEGPNPKSSAMSLCNCTNCAFVFHAVDVSGPYEYFTISMSDGSAVLDVRGNRLWAICGMDDTRESPSIFYVDPAYCIRTFNGSYLIWSGSPGDAFTTSSAPNQTALKWLPMIPRHEITKNSSCSSVTEKEEADLSIPGWLQRELDARANTIPVTSFVDAVMTSESDVNASGVLRNPHSLPPIYW